MKHLALVLLFCAALPALDDALVRRLQGRFLAPCCWQESLAVHQSEIAVQLRAEIARLAAAGRPEDDIVDTLVARYGERILVEPRGARLRWLNVIPPIAVALAAAALFFVIRRLRRPGPPRPVPATLPPLPDLDMD